MKKDIYDIANLIAIELTGEISEQQQQELMTWVEATPENAQLFEHMRKSKKLRQKLTTYRNTDWQTPYEKFQKNTHTAKPRRHIAPIIIRYAAIFMLPLSIAIGITWYYNSDDSDNKDIETIFAQNPTSNRAILTLGNGEQIALTDQTSNIVSPEEPITISGNDKQLSYTKVESATPIYNTLSTPRGGEYTVTFSDGTIVHLNASTDLRYPVTFDKDKREVYLSGEAWFEVTKNTSKPFYVITDDVKIRVYGTKFNVNTMNPGVVETVLVNGRVSVKSAYDTQEVFLKPAQLGAFDKTTGSITVSDVDIMSYIGWKDGCLVFSGKTLEYLMNKIELWYDVDVEFTEERLKSIRFSGYLERYDETGVILKAIEDVAGVKININNRIITISE